jgi:hypothetical protein
MSPIGSRVRPFIHSAILSLDFASQSNFFTASEFLAQTTIDRTKIVEFDMDCDRIVNSIISFHSWNVERPPAEMSKKSRSKKDENAEGNEVGYIFKV